MKRKYFLTKKIGDDMAATRKLHRLVIKYGLGELNPSWTKKEKGKWKKAKEKIKHISLKEASDLGWAITEISKNKKVK